MHMSSEIQRCQKFTQELKKSLTVGRAAKRKLLTEAPQSSSRVFPPVGDQVIEVVEECPSSPKKSKILHDEKPITEFTKLELLGEISIGVIVMGDISPRIFATWCTNLPKRIPASKFNFTSKFNTAVKLDIIVADVRLSRDQIVRALGEGHYSSPILGSQFIIDAIKTSSMPLIENFLHPVQINCSYSVAESKIASLPPASPIASPAPSSAPTSPTIPSLPTSPTKPIRAGSTKSYPKMDYACVLTGSTERSANSNKYLTDVLEELQKVYELIHDEWRANGYKKCVAIIKQMPRITHISQLDNVKGIGSSMREKIEEIIVTGNLKKLSFFKSDPKIQALSVISQIWGVGEKSASQLIKQGFTSIQHLRGRGQHLLTTQQKIGLKYYEEFLEKIPRQEVQQIEHVVQTAAMELFGKVECQACGSYRRGKPASGDVDILISPSKELDSDYLPSNALLQLIERLSASGFLTDHLSMPSAAAVPASSTLPDSLGGLPKEQYRSSYMGVCQLAAQGLHRRIDIKIYPRSLLALAMLYFTGSDHFNRSMRLYAKRRGFHLSDKHLIYQERVAYFADQFPYTVGQTFPCDSEEDVFEVLKLPYKEPTERNVFDIDHLLTEEEKEEYRQVPVQSNRLFFRHDEDNVSK